MTDAEAHYIMGCLIALDKKKSSKSHYIKKKNDKKKINEYNFNGVLHGIFFILNQNIISHSVPMGPTILRYTIGGDMNYRKWEINQLHIVGPVQVMGSTSTMIMCARATPYWSSFTRLM